MLFDVNYWININESHCKLLPKFDVKFTDRISALWSEVSHLKTSVTTTKEECETLDVVCKRVELSPVVTDYFKAQVFLLPKSEMNKGTAGPDSYHKLDQTGRGEAAA